MDYLAHTENERGVPHQLKDHLRSVGKLASEFAARMNPAMCDAARWARRSMYNSKHKVG